MSNEGDRPRHAGDYADSGRYTQGAEGYSNSGYGAAPTRSDTSSGYFDEGGFSNQETTVLPEPSAYDSLTEEGEERRRAGWHAGADFGLLVLRLVLGAFFIAHAGQKLFGWFQGGGIGGTAEFVGGLGFTNTTLIAWVAGVAELAGGAFVLLGLFTPAGAAIILTLTGSAIWVKFNGNEFLGNVELEAIYAAAAFALLFAGPGRVSLDRPTPWYRHPSAFGVVALLLAAAASVTFLVVYH
ncbi:MAG TPA: DoxX family protein [Actinophytocola sp.]|uniref:DoxX family protein n=1 Tax=Actinophytocola sp. TaxID=1872138 RepID=UPI002DDD4B6F|nr:DoxX family protein [Actinophytocola sp.]HEV2782156.1 DoxX family protein [Actinophytocola sp.]